MSKIYVASSWRNAFQPAVVSLLVSLGHSVYDFRNPGPSKKGFAWSDIDIDWRNWTPSEFRGHLSDEIADRGYLNDYNAMKDCDCCVLVLPCGRSAHTEAGWFAGQGKEVTVLMLAKEEPELMYNLFDGDICVSFSELEQAFQ